MTHPNDSCLLKQILNMQAVTSEDLPALWQQGALTFSGVSEAPICPTIQLTHVMVSLRPLDLASRGAGNLPLFPKEEKQGQRAQVSRLLSQKAQETGHSPIIHPPGGAGSKGQDQISPYPHPFIFLSSYFMCLF